MSDIEEGKVIAGLIYFFFVLSILGWIISVVLYFTKKDNSFVKYHFQQWVALVISAIVVAVVGAATSIILIGIPILVIGVIALLVLWIIGMVNAFTGQQKPLPIIGAWGEKLNL